MPFSVDQRLLHCNVTLKLRTNVQTCPMSTCVNWPDSLDYRNSLELALPQVRYNLLTTAYFVINDFSDIVFFKKDSYPTWRLLLDTFFLLILSQFLKTAHEKVLAAYIIWSCTFRFSARTSIFILTKPDLLLNAELIIIY